MLAGILPSLDRRNNLIFSHRFLFLYHFLNPHPSLLLLFLFLVLLLLTLHHFFRLFFPTRKLRLLPPFRSFLLRVLHSLRFRQSERRAPSDILRVLRANPNPLFVQCFVENCSPVCVGRDFHGRPENRFFLLVGSEFDLEEIVGDLALCYGGLRVGGVLWFLVRRECFGPVGVLYADFDESIQCVCEKVFLFFCGDFTRK